MNNRANSDKLFAVNLNGKWGYINSDGKNVIKPIYHMAYRFQDGLAVVRSRKGWGAIDRSGEWVIMPSYYQMMPFSDDLAMVRDENGNGGFVDRTGKMIKTPADIMEDFSDGLARAYTIEGPVFIDKKGQIVFKSKYAWTWPFSEGFAVVANVSEQKKQERPERIEEYNSAQGILGEIYAWGSYGYIDKKGNEITALQFDKARGFSDRLAAVKMNEKWGYIGSSGSMIIDPQFDDALSFSEGKACVNKAGKWGVIDTAGKTIVDYKYDGMLSFSEGLAAAKIDGKWGFVNASSQIIVPPSYDEVKSFANGMAAIMTIDGSAEVNEQGPDPIKMPGMHYNPESDPGGRTADLFRAYAQRSRNNKAKQKWGFVGKQGQIIVKPQYSGVNDFSEGLARIIDGDKMGYIDSEGKRVW